MNEDRKKEILSRPLVKLVREGEEVVISGVGCRLPQSNSMDEFADNLYKNEYLVTEDTTNERWPHFLYGMNQHMGRVKDIDKFDGAFFGILSRAADGLDPASRMMLETTYEAIADAGYVPSKFANTRTGVYVGNNTVGTAESYPQELQKDMRPSLINGSVWLGSSGKNMLANRLSYNFNFRGPSVVIDTACSSAMVAFEAAVKDIRLGVVDQAIVGCGQINLMPMTNHYFQTTLANAPDGRSKVWDKDADGFIRGETVGCLFLQRRSAAKRVYATVVHAKTNVDGYKTSGNFFPSAESQAELLEETLVESGIESDEIEYFEAHGTGTKVGDPQEAKAIAGVYCKDRKKDLIIGLLKSVIGHGEGTSGLASITKTLISFEHNCIAANLNLKTIKPEIAVFCPPLKPVVENTPFNPKYAAINCFGLGGVNGHTILKANEKVEQDQRVVVDLPRLINACGRTQEGLDHILNWIQNNPDKVTNDFLAILGDFVKIEPSLNNPGFPYRGSMLIKKKTGEDGKEVMEYTKESSTFIGMHKPIWFFFSGMGSQWVGMAKEMMQIKTFANTVNKCADVLRQHGVDLIKIITSDDPKSLDSITNPFVAITSIQCALFDLLTELQIHPDGIIGHSFGEIACAYADGCLTLEETILCSFWRGKVVADGNIPDGAMAAVGLSYKEAKKRCKNAKNVFVACDNAPDSVTISGLKEDVAEFVAKLKADNVFVRDVAGFGLKPYHSSMLNPLIDVLTRILSQVIPEPKRRSDKWYSTSIPENDWHKEVGKTAGADYFVNNLVKPVLFASAIKHLPHDGIVIEVAPHALFASLIKRSVETANYVGLMKRNNDGGNIEMFLKSLGKLYQLGVNVCIEKLYPKVEWPVARGTQSISSLLKWDHAESYFIKRWPEYWFPATSSDMTFRFSLDNPDDVFLTDHKIDGRVLFPASGYLMLAWRRLAGSRGQQWKDFPVVFEGVRIHRPVLFEKDKIKLTVRYLEPTGQFLILDNGNVVCTGKIYSPEDTPLMLQHLVPEDNVEPNEFTLNSDDFYKDLKVRGYDYGKEFQGVVESKFVDIHRVEGKIKWANNSNSITFMDAFFQILINSLPIRSLFAPVGIESLRCDPEVLFTAISQRKVIEVKQETIDFEIQEKKEEGEVVPEGQEAVHAATKNEEEKSAIADIKKVYGSELQEIKEEMDSVLSEMGSGTQKWTAILPVAVDSRLNCIVTKGLEVTEILPVNIPRRPQKGGLRLEKYEFVPNEEVGAIDRCLKREVEDYIDTCTDLCLELAKSVGSPAKAIGEIAQRRQASGKRIKSSADINPEEIREDQILLKMLNEVNKAKSDENKNPTEGPELVQKLKDELKKPEFDLTADCINQAGRNERLIRPMLDLVNENHPMLKEVRVVEVNLTGGLIAAEVADWQRETFITPVNINYQIVSHQPDVFQSKAEFKNLGLNFKKWTKETAFPEGISGADMLIHRDHFDLWSLDLDQYVQGAYDAVKENGFLLAVFRSKISDPEVVLSGLIENGDRIQPVDSELKKRISDFEAAAVKLGFSVINRKSDSFLFDALLLRKMNKEPVDVTKQTVVHIKTGGADHWLADLQAKLEDYKQRPKGENIWLVAEDNNNGIMGLLTCLRVESGGEKLRVVFDPEKRLPKPFDLTKHPQLLSNDLVQNIYQDGAFGSFRHLTLSKDFDQVPTEEAYVNVVQRGDLSSLQWFNGTNLTMPVSGSKETRDHIEIVPIDVYYSALNFRDVMMATGRIQPGPEGAVLDSILGYEVAGRRRDNGKRVFGMSISYGLSTSISLLSPLFYEVPDHWSMEDAATIYVVYMTAWYGLCDRGRIQPGESILIHSAAGGVGQAAINICQHLGCKIFVTVGGQEKRDFLKSKFGLTDDCIFNSRTVDFEKQVMAATDGKGVDLVINSLAEDKLLASFRCLGQDGRFIEIGKFDMQMNNPLPMFRFLKNIAFHGVALDKIGLLESKAQLQVCYDFKKWLQDGIDKGYVKPLNTNVFNRDQVRDAFKFMMTGKHTGKVLVRVRDEEPEKVIIAKPVKMMATAKTWFDPKKVYIVVGGLGGMGLEMIYWMVLRGCKKIVVTSRSGIKANHQRLFFKHLEELGKFWETLAVDIKIVTEDGVTFESAKSMIEAAEGKGRIGGIFQLAVVLHDDLLENQTPETFQIVAESKVNVTEHLDLITRRLDYPVEYFVVFSSMSAGRGNSGQSPYGYACSVMERICEDRRRAGHHGLAIQWGPIGDVGALVDSANEDRLRMVGLISQRVPSWTYALDKFLGAKEAVVASCIRDERQVQSGNPEENMMKQFWASLGVDPKTVPNHVMLGELGMESFVAIEMQQRMERDYDISLTINEIKRLTVGDFKEFEAGNKDIIKRYSADIKESRQKLMKIKVPTEQVTKLNTATEGEPAYFLPTGDGMFVSVAGLAEQLPFPVYGLNWTKEVDQLPSMKEVADYYMNLLKTIHPKGKYNLLSYFFGSVIASKMLQKKAPIRKLFIIDAFSSKEMNSDLSSLRCDEEFEQLFRLFSTPQSLRERVRQKVLSVKEEDKRIAVFKEMIFDFAGRNINQVKNDLNMIIDGALSKRKQFHQFRNKMFKKLEKIKGMAKLGQKATDYMIARMVSADVVIIKATEDPDDRHLLEEELQSTYGISAAAIEGNYHLEIIVASPDELMLNHLNETAEIVRKNY